MPDVVLMSEDEPTPGLRKMMTSALGRRHVKFIRGSTMDQSALARADAMNADMVFVLGNLSVLDSDTRAEVGAPTPLPTSVRPLHRHNTLNKGELF